MVWSRPDGGLQSNPATMRRQETRSFLRHRACARRGGPLTQSVSIPVRCEPKKPTAVRIHLFISVDGAAWLFMSQPGVTRTRVIADPGAPDPPSTETTAQPGRRDPSAVTLVDLRRTIAHRPGLAQRVLASTCVGLSTPLRMPPPDASCAKLSTGTDCVDRASAEICPGACNCGCSQVRTQSHAQASSSMGMFAGHRRSATPPPCVHTIAPIWERQQWQPWRNLAVV